jgi:hypothetical protein
VKPIAPLFDRRIPAGLFSALADDGAFAWVTALAREPLTRQRPLDLGLRKDPKTQAAHATLYVGTTKVLDIKRTAGGRFALRSEQTGGLFGHIHPPFETAWTRPQALADLVSAMPCIRARVEAAIAVAPEERRSEGFLQAAVAKATRAAIVPVDREIMFSWISNPVKASGKAALRRPLDEAQRALSADYVWAAGHRPPGDKIDALALDSRGRVMVIEVKPGGQRGTAVWTPVQVGMYLQLVTAWVADDPAWAAKVLTGMADQRRELGLTTGPLPAVGDPPEVVPVIAFGTPVERPEDAGNRFSAVRDAVMTAGIDLNALELWAVDGETGEVTRTDAATLDNRFAARAI